MKLLYFPGCKLEQHLPAYDAATRAVLSQLSIQLVELELNCCGYPVRHQSFTAFLLSAARNLALADARRLNILTPCKCCFGSLRHALHWLRRKPALRQEINRHLAREGLRWEDRSEVIHLLSLLRHQVGIDQLKASVTAPLSGMQVAAHYGCHALRPVDITAFDNPTAPRIFEDLVAVTGATPVSWSVRFPDKISPVCPGLILQPAIDKRRTYLAQVRFRNFAFEPRQNFARIGIESLGLVVGPYPVSKLFSKSFKCIHIIPFVLLPFQSDLPAELLTFILSFSTLKSSL